jgi:hypothetical protein
LRAGAGKPPSAARLGGLYYGRQGKRAAERALGRPAQSSSRRCGGVWLVASVAGVVASGLGAAAWAQATWVGTYRLQLRVNPTELPADGKTRCRLQAEVRQFDGSPAPDGTQVVFTTDLGWLGVSEAQRSASATAATRGGVAVVYLRSETAGVATVQALIQQTRASVRVTFLPPGAPVPARAARLPRSLYISGSWVGYCADANAIEARGRSRLTYGPLTLEVNDVAVLDLATLRLHATNVTVRGRERVVEAQDLVAELESRVLYLRRFVEGSLVRESLAADSLLPIDAKDILASLSFSPPAVEGSVWFIGSGARVFPGEKIVLEDASLYSGLQKVVSLPHFWIIAMPGYTGASNSSILGVNSEGNLAVDLPFFYRVTDQWTGAVKLQRGASMAGVPARQAWTAAVQEEYCTADGTRGALFVQGLPYQDWGFGWRDQRRLFGGCEVFSDLSLPDHRSRFFNTTVFSPRAGYQFSFSASYDKPAGYPSSGGLAAEWLTYPKPFLGSTRAAYSLGTALSLVRQPEEGGGKGWLFGQELYTALDCAAWGIGENWSLTPRLQNVFAWYDDGTTTNALRHELTLAGRLGASSDVRLLYSAQLSSGDVARKGWRQELDFYLSASRGRWRSYLSASRDLTAGSQLATWALDYQLASKWRLGSLITSYHFGGERFHDLELTLGREFYGQEIGVRWSKETGRFSISVVGLSRSF